MARIIPVITGGADPTTPSGPQYGVKYVLTGPDGTRAVFNDSTDRDYVGALTEITGLDSPDVRENASDLVEQDGGIHGNFYYGRRPITVTGMIFNVVSTTERNVKMAKLQRASNAMRSDGKLSWTPDGGIEQFISVRRQQPLRITGAWAKTFNIALVSADPRIYGADLRTGFMSNGTQLTATNLGNAESWPLLSIYGPCTNPVVMNVATNQRLVINTTVAANTFLTVDTLNRTVIRSVDGGSDYGKVDFVNSSWWPIYAGPNTLQVTYGSFSAGASVTVQ